jgi:hypothetical protein
MIGVCMKKLKDERTGFSYFDTIINSACLLFNHFHIGTDIIGELLDLHHVVVDMVYELLSCPGDLFDHCDLKLSVDMVCDLECSRHRRQNLLLC